MEKFDIVLIDPPNSLASKLRKKNSLPHLGLLSVAAVIERAGYKVKYIDAPALGLNIQQCCDETIKYNPKYIGLTATTPMINCAAQIAKLLKQKTSATIILGGVHVTSAPSKTMKIFREFDVGVIKEGEETIIDLLNALEHNLPLKEVKGIVRRKENQILLTPQREFITDLDSLPLPAWHLLPEMATHYQPNYMCTRRLPSNHMITSRGCYGQCLFCDKSVTGGKIRVHSVERVLQMIEILRNKYGIRDLQFNDDTFVALKDRAHQICDEIIRRQIDITWSCDARVNGIDQELMNKMKKAGCWQISFGIESGSQEVLNFIRKGITLEQVKKAVNYARNAGIKVKGFFILGHPTETKETIEKTIKLISSLKIDDFGLTFFTPYPGSPFYPIASEYGQFKEDWNAMQGYFVDTFVPKGFTKQDLVNYRKIAHKKFYLRPRVIISKILEIRTPFDLWKFIISVIAFSKKFLTKLMILNNSDKTT